MSHFELSAVPPIHTTTKRQRWRGLTGPLGCGQKLLWIGFLGQARRLMKTMSQVPIGPRPTSAARTVPNDMPSDLTVELLWTGPGPGTGGADRV